jgi:hypothetical protein
MSGDWLIELGRSVGRGGHWCIVVLPAPGVGVAPDGET